MFRLIAAIAALMLPATVAFAQSRPEPVQVMILATPHFGNPGQDVHNMRADPVTTPEKQVEMQALAAALAEFRPTVIAVERVADDLRDPVFPTLTTADLTSRPDERVQIGYRLAWNLGLDKVYAIDEQPGEGERDYFPFGRVMAWAQANGQGERMGQMSGAVGRLMAEMEQRQRSESVGRFVARFNDPAEPLVRDAQAMYYGMLTMGDAVDQPGAELNAGWYERNAKIFAKLLRVAQPGDRVVVVFGAGHAYWLRHFVETMPGFELVEPNAYLGRFTR